VSVVVVTGYGQKNDDGMTAMCQRPAPLAHRSHAGVLDRLPVGDLKLNPYAWWRVR
jgi:hypothetical protein